MDREAQAPTPSPAQVAVNQVTGYSNMYCGTHVGSTSALGNGDFSKDFQVTYPGPAKSSGSVKLYAATDPPLAYSCAVASTPDWSVPNVVKFKCKVSLPAVTPPTSWPNSPLFVTVAVGFPTPFPDPDAVPV